MALLLKNKTYLRITIDNIYEIYASKTARMKYKKAVSIDTIQKKYSEKINELSMENNPEKFYYMPEIAYKELDDWYKEYERFMSDYGSRTTGQHYPLIEQYFPKANLAIPPIISKGYIDLPGATVAEKYEYLKKFKIFGPVEEIEDI